VEARAQIVDREACMECGACANNCETGAIRVRAGVGCALALIQGMIRGTAPQA
jgi:NAD-dependent dihydropyrimidine dehydrogenase PreA subunit